MSDNIMVSICCLTYNHSKYIRKTIDGFLNQKTNFKYEVLIHDDASTDNTAEIIREYESKYPDIIKPIYQTENQYSKNVKISRTFQYPRAKGKYIAFCEGDDYWCDDSKLQLQVDAMENDETISICAHKVQMIYENEDLVGVFIPRFQVNEGVIKSEELVKYICGIQQPIFQTSSFFFRKSDCIEAIKTTPDFMKISSFGDVQNLMFHSLKGNCYYIDKVMSRYRIGVSTSWTVCNNQNPQRTINSINETKKVYSEFNKYTDFKYDKYVNEYLVMQDYRIAIASENYKEQLKPKYNKYRKYYSDTSFRGKFKVFVLGYFPFIKKVYVKLREGNRNNEF